MPLTAKCEWSDEKEKRGKREERSEKRRKGKKTKKKEKKKETRAKCKEKRRAEKRAKLKPRWKEERREERRERREGRDFFWPILGGDLVLLLGPPKNFVHSWPSNFFTQSFFLFLFLGAPKTLGP